MFVPKRLLKQSWLALTTCSQCTNSSACFTTHCVWSAHTPWEAKTAYRVWGRAAEAGDVVRSPRSLPPPSTADSNPTRVPASQQLPSSLPWQPIHETWAECRQASLGDFYLRSLLYSECATPYAVKAEFSGAAIGCFSDPRWTRWHLKLSYVAAHNFIKVLCFSFFYKWPLGLEPWGRAVGHGMCPQWLTTWDIWEHFWIVYIKRTCTWIHNAELTFDMLSQCKSLVKSLNYCRQVISLRRSVVSTIFIYLLSDDNVVCFHF